MSTRCSPTFLFGLTYVEHLVTRTAGLCYGSSIESLVEHGTLCLKIYRAPDAIAALAAIRKVLASVVAGKTDISRTDLEAAKSQIAFATVEDQRTPDDAVSFRPLHPTLILTHTSSICRRARRSSTLSS